MAQRSYKLKQSGIPGNILNTIIEFPRFRKQRVVLNEQISHSSSIEAEVPQGTILGELLFLFNISNLSDEPLFADDTSFFSIVSNIDTSATHLNNSLRKFCK